MHMVVHPGLEMKKTQGALDVAIAPSGCAVLLHDVLL
jgi:hypothetical protein